MPKYEIINAGMDVLNFATQKGNGMVQPNTRRVLDIDEELSDLQIERYGSRGVFVKKSGEAAQNEDPLPRFDADIASARNRLMVSAGQERADIVEGLRGGKKAARKATGGAAASGGASPAPSTTPPSTATAAAGATTGGAGTTTTVTGR